MTHAEHRARWKAIADYIRADPSRTCQDAMIEFDLSAQTVRDACYLHNVPLRRLNAASEPERHVGNVTVKALTLVARLLDPALTYPQIADEFGLTRQAIADADKRATAAGIRFPSRSRRKQETK